MKNRLFLAFLSLFLVLPFMASAQKTCNLSDLDLSKVTSFTDGGQLHVGKNVTVKGNPIVIKGTTYANGVGVHAPSVILVKLNGATKFTSLLGVTDEADDKPDHGIIDYEVTKINGDVNTSVQKGTIKRAEPDNQTVELNVDLAGAEYLLLELKTGAQPWADHAAWANAVFEYNGEAPALITEIHPSAKKVADLSNNKIYTLKSPRGWMTAKDDIAASTAKSGQTGGYNVPECQWAIFKSDRGLYYMYNVNKSNDKKFLGFQNQNNKAIPMVADPVTDKLSFKETGNAEYPLMPIFNGVGAINHSTNLEQGLVTWTGGLNATGDDGNKVQITEVGSVSADVLSAIQAKVKKYEDKLFAERVELPAKGPHGGEVIPLSSLELSKTICGWKTNQKDMSIEGNPISIGGVVYASGVGSHASSQIIVKLNGSVTHFHAVIGIDDEVDAESEKVNTTTKRRSGIADYKVYVKGENGHVVELQKGTVKYNDAKGVAVDVDVNGFKYLFLETEGGEGGIEGDHINWANAYFEYQEQNSTRPVIVSAEEISSKLACATVLFSQPGVRFMHKVRASNPDATLAVEGLPAGLTWNAKRNLVEGVVDNEGEYGYKVLITLDGETIEEPIKLTVSSQLQQPVPFMGWLSWNVVERNISEDIIRKVADAFHSQGLYEAGYKYLCIDDLWHADQRAADGKPLPHPKKFPHGMKVCADYVHEKGLKFGIYSDAASHTCAGAFGSFGYEEIDAKQYAEWGVDLLKYDYCGGPSDAKSAENRYKAMGDALKASGRDILFYMCEWGVREPWKWGVNTGATTWRCTYDTRDGWVGKGAGIGVVQSIAGMKDLWAYSGPNRFNDADMMCVGIHGKGGSSNDLVQGTPGMTQDEYRTQFALWCMWSSPLTLSFDLSKPISKDDLSIMTHKELIAINQDRMGQQAELISEADDMIVFAKDLENGDVAISVTNMSNAAKNFTFEFAKIGALDENETYNVRNVWAMKNEGTAQATLNTRVASHATKVYRLSKQHAAKSVDFVKIEGDKIVGAEGTNIATFSANYATVVPEGVKAYHVVEGDQNATSVKMVEIIDNIPAYQGAILVSNQTSADMVAAEGVVKPFAKSLLRGTADRSVVMTEADYVMATLDGVTQFYKADGTLAAGKAFLKLPAGKALSLGMDFGGESTAIEGVEAETIAAPVYDLSGRRVNENLKSGIYIKNGKKFIVR